MKKSIRKTKTRISFISLVAAVVLLAGMAVGIGLVLEKQGLFSFARTQSECAENSNCEGENQYCQIKKTGVGKCVRLKKNECETDADCKKQSEICKESGHGRKTCVKADRNDKEEIDWKANGRCLPANNPDKRCDRKAIKERCDWKRLWLLSIVKECKWVDNFGTNKVSGCVCD